ncbi:hypothetical protein EJB05_10191, partial [Eragrostis curvula]
MTVRETVLDDILTTCTRLELLCLEACDAGRRTTLWRVRHARLADLRISYCVFGAVHLVWLPRLERFAYRYCEYHTHDPLSFGHVPHLTTLTISKNHVDEGTTVKLSQILANTAVQDLRLKIWVQKEPPKRLTDVFRHLKYLKVRNVHEECSLTWIMFLLQSAPFLKELYIKVYIFHYINDDITEDILVTYICHLVRAAINLEEIRMRKNAACEDCGLSVSGVTLPMNVDVSGHHSDQTSRSAVEHLPASLFTLATVRVEALQMEDIAELQRVSWRPRRMWRLVRASMSSARTPWQARALCELADAERIAAGARALVPKQLPCSGRLHPRQDTSYTVLVGCRGRVTHILHAYTGNAVVRCTATSWTGD